MDVHTATAIHITVLVGRGRIVTLRCIGIQCTVGAGMVRCLNAIDTVNDRHSTVVGCAGAIIGIVGQGRTVFTIEGNIGIAAGILLHHDDNALGTGIIGRIFVSVGRIVIRTALKHEDDVLTVIQSSSQLALGIKIMLHHGIDIGPVPGVGNKSGTGQIIDAADGLCLHRSKHRDQSQQQAAYQQKG